MIKYFYPIWGSEELPIDIFFERIKKAGYTGVEMNIPYDEFYINELKNKLKSFELELIAQQYLPPLKETFSEYMKRLSAYMLHLISFNPRLINSHTGKDYFTFEENCQIIDYLNNLSKKYTIDIIHETHRGRFLFSTFTAREYFTKYPNLRN